MSSPSVVVPASPARDVWLGLLLAGLGSVAFSGKAIVAKLMYRHGADAVQVLFYRMLLALPLFLALAWWAGRGRQALAWRDWKIIALLGLCGYYLASFLDFLGLQYISASLERLILYLNPTLVLLLGAWFLKRRVSAPQLAALALSYGGVLLVFGREMGASHGAAASGAPPALQVVLGSLLVLGSALSYAVYLVMSGEVVQRIGSLRLTGLATTVACVLCIVQFFVLRPVAALWVPEPVLWLSLLNAVCCTFVPVVVVMLAVERIGASLAAQTGMVGPLSTVGMGVWILGEPFHAGLALGTVLVLAGVWLLARWR
jgi:drug/metabolite transporter (DMT)-like permease